MMPAAVDHHQRRAHLAAVFIGLLADGGMEAVSVRSVAARAGVSIGTVQHYFPTKAAMLLHAREAVSAALEARVEAATEGLDGPWDVLRAVLGAVLPADAEVRGVLQVLQAFEAAAVHDPALAEVSRRDDDDLLTAVGTLLDLGGVAHPRMEARLLVSLLGGLSQMVLLAADQETAAAEAATALARQVDRLESSG